LTAYTYVDRIAQTFNLANQTFKERSVTDKSITFVTRLMVQGKGYANGSRRCHCKGLTLLHPTHATHT